MNQPRYNSAGEKNVTGEAFDITKNLNPQKAYKLKVKINGVPGEFKSARAVASFDIGNIKECGYYLGGSYQGTVPGVERDIEFPLIQLSDTEYEGVFYTDWGKDGDFFGKGVCHWVFTYAGVAFKATGDKGETQFVAGFNDKYDHKTREYVVRGADDEFDSKQTKSQTRFYRKAEYPKDSELPNYVYRGFSEKIARQHSPNQLFSITVTTEEMVK